jgi:predicted O-methyltransferase YrrM
MSRESIGLDERLNRYVASCGDPEHPVAAELRQLTGKMAEASMQISPEQGQLLAFLAKLVGARNTLEIGTFTGYSALWVALALPADGRVVACDVSREWTDVARRYWRKAGVAERIDLRLGPAAATLAALERDGWSGRFDLAFIDADKGGYEDYFESALRLVRPGGVIALDNMLWSGRVADPKARDSTTRLIRDLNAAIAADPRVDRIMVPLGDGLMVARRIE